MRNVHKTITGVQTLDRVMKYTTYKGNWILAVYLAAFDFEVSYICLLHYVYQIGCCLVSSKGDAQILPCPTSAVSFKCIV